MKFKEERGIAYCGLACVLCSYEGYDDCLGCTVNKDDRENDCNIRQCTEKKDVDGCFTCSDYPCGKENNDCFVRQCARKKGVDGCFTCPDYPCGKDWSPFKSKRNKEFIRYAQEFGKQALIDRLRINYKNGIDHMPDKFPGDNDVSETEDEIYQLLRYGYNIPLSDNVMNDKFRCFGDIPIYKDYHDNEWGRPVHDDFKLFEMLILEGAQAGLSWITVLKKREAYRNAFDGFDPKKVALYGGDKISELMTNEGIIRNRLKIHAAITNAKLFIEIQEKYTSFDKFIWGYVDHKPITGHWEKFGDIPLTTPISDKISNDLKKMGFKFVGSTIIYSFMQAVGMVNDHLLPCFVYEELCNY